MIYLSRCGVFYFRFLVMKDKSIRVSLGTRQRKEALHLAGALRYTGKQLLSTLQGSMEYQAIRNVLCTHFRQFLEYRKQKIHTEGPLSEADKLALQRNHWQSLEGLHEREINRIIAAYGLPVEEGDASYPLVKAEFLKAYTACCKALLQYNEQQSEYSFDQPVPSAPQMPVKRQRKLADTLEEYITEKLRLKHWREHIAKEYRGQFNLLLRYLGPDASLLVSEELARDIKNMLILMPKNATKMPALRDLSIPELMQIKGYQRLNAVTVSKLLLTYSTFYDWAVKAKYISENNFASLVDDVKKVHIEREEFSPADIQRIFAKALESKKAHQKWGVLIAFYTGARLNEIAQLMATDIVQQNDVPCISFSDGGDTQRLKNKASRRVIPIHSHLIDLGFLKFVKQAGQGRLFKELPFHPKDGYGRNLGRWFNTSLLRDQLDIQSKTLVFHSIRHTVANRLRNSRVDAACIKDILGHAHSDVTMSVYANSLDRKVMQEAIQKLQYS